MKIRIVKEPLSKYQTAGEVNNDDSWIRKILEYEATKGSATGTGLSNWGYNSRNPKSIDEAIEFFKQDYLPKVQQYPMGMRERAADFIYNTGVDPRIYLLDQYIAQKEKRIGLPGRSLYKEQSFNSPTFENIYSQYQPKIDALPLEERIKLLDQGKDYYYRNIDTLDFQHGAPFWDDRVEPNPAYYATWKGRVNMWGPYNAPAVANNNTVAQQPAANDSNTVKSNSQPAVVPTASVPSQQKIETTPNNTVTSASPSVVSAVASSLGNFPFKYAPKQSPGSTISKPTLGYKPQGLPPISNELKIRYGLPVTASDFKDYDDWQAAGAPKLSAKNLEFDGYFKSDENKKKPFLTPGRVKLAKNISNIGNAVLAAGTALEHFQQPAKIKEWERFYRSQNFDKPTSGEFEGNYSTNAGIFQPNRLPTPNEGMFMNGGTTFLNDGNMKIRIIAGPQKMAYGGQSGYGLDIGQRKILTDMPDLMHDYVSDTLTAVPREMANIEAEGGETLYGDIDGDGAFEHMKIEGERHSKGGVPIKAPEGSFIFSDTKKMRIKDPNILNMFGKSGKGVYTPAQLAKQYDLNKYKSIMEDPNADYLSKATAQLMAKNYNKKLANLAMVQEQMKGFPQGIPQVAQGLMEATSDLAQAAYGGYIPKFDVGGPGTIDPYKGGKQNTPTNKSNKYNRGKEYLESWESVIPGISSLPNKDAQRLIYRYILNTDPDRINNMWQEYGLTNEGKRYKDLINMTDKNNKGKSTYTFSNSLTPEQLAALERAYVDGKFGVRQLDVINKPKPVIAPPLVKEVPKQEPYKNPDIEPNPLKETTVRKPPFDYLFPDRVNMLASAASFMRPPKAYMPYSRDLDFTPGNYALPDWLSRAQEIQQTYNTAANTLGNYQPGTALASNLSFMAGQTADNVAQAIAQNAEQSVGAYNQFETNELSRKDKVDLYNTMNAKERYDNATRGKQAYDNARREFESKFFNNTAKEVSNAWNNRMKMGLLNAVNPIYNIDPNSGQSYFMNGYGPEYFRSVGNSKNLNADTLKKFTNAKSKYKAADMSETLAEKLASQEVFGSNFGGSSQDANELMKVLSMFNSSSN